LIEQRQEGREGELGEIIELIDRFAPVDGSHDSAIPGLRLIRASRTSKPVPAVYEPSLCVIAQGAKTVTVAGESYRYDPSTYLVTSVRLPISSHITSASPEVPYLSLQLSFEAQQILEVLRIAPLPPEKPLSGARGFSVTKMDPFLLDGVLRLLRLLAMPQDIPALSPLHVREILYRVMQGEHGGQIAQFATAGSHEERVSAVIRLIGHEYARPLKAEDLAAEAHLSVTSLYEHFARVTGMSPLQYQKRIRLQEARRLLMSGGYGAAEAGFLVGYESPSHFSREYTRMFGFPPIKDLERLRKIPDYGC